jgi:hypothetical protein
VFFPKSAAYLRSHIFLPENSRNFVFGASTNNGRRAGIGTGTSVDP